MLLAARLLGCSPIVEPYGRKYSFEFSTCGGMVRWIRRKSIQIPLPPAPAANASGFIQTALSKVTRRTFSVLAHASARRVTPDRVLSLPVSNGGGHPLA
jgi:hypothetical protein